jgi:hypothetical protein
VSVSFRVLAATAVAAAAMTVPLSGAVATATPHAGAAPRPGLTATPITLAGDSDLTGGYDAATTAAGTTYIAWIAAKGGANRTVYLCILPLGKTACSGGIQSTPSLGISSAQGIHVIVTGGKVTLVWFHDTNRSGDGPENAKIATATVQNGKLSAAQNQAPAPSFGILEDVAAGPGGTIWTVSVHSGTQSVQVIPGLGNKPVTVATPYLVSTDQGVQLAFAGSTAVMAIQMGGSISQPISYASEQGGKWTAFKELANTWTAAANLGLVQTRRGVRALASIDNASYQPVVSKWTGSSFSPRTLTGDHSACAPSSHDPVADASGRMADASNECENVAIANLTDTLHAAVVRFPSGGTIGGGIPQVATTPRGHGWAIWSIEATTSDNLLAAAILLPGRDVNAQATGQGNQVKLTGPASCLPPVGIAVKVAGTPAANWKVTASTLALDGSTLSGKTLDGSALKAGTAHTLTGTVTFSKGATHLPVTATLKFSACPNP